MNLKSGNGKNGKIWEHRPGENVLLWLTEMQLTKQI